MVFGAFFVPTASNGESGPLKATSLGASSPYAVDNNPKKGSFAASFMCGVCGEREATRDCKKCGGAMCNVCDIDLHTKGLLNHHEVRKFEPGKLQSTYMDSQPLLVDHAEAKKEEPTKPPVHEEAAGGGGHGEGGHGDDEHHYVERDYLTPQDKLYAVVVTILAFIVVIIMCIWSIAGLMAEHELVHAIGTTTRPGHIHGTLYSTPVDIHLHGTETKFFEIRLIMMATKDFSGHGHRRLASPLYNPLLSAPMNVSELMEDSENIRRLQHPDISHDSASSHTDSHSSSDSHSGHSTDSHDSHSSPDSHTDHSTDSHSDHSTDSHSDHSTDHGGHSMDSHSDHSADSHSGLSSDSHGDHSADSHSGHSTDSHSDHSADSHSGHATDSHSDHSADSHSGHSTDSHSDHSADDHSGHSTEGHGGTEGHDSHDEHSTDSHADHGMESHTGHDTHSTDSHSDHGMDSHGDHSADSHADHSDSHDGDGHGASEHGHDDAHGDTHEADHGHGDEHGASEDHVSTEHDEKAGHDDSNNHGSTEDSGHGASDTEHGEKHDEGHGEKHDDEHGGHDDGHDSHDDGHDGHDAGDHAHGAHAHVDPWGKLTYRLFKDGEEVFKNTVNMKDPDVEYEEFKTVNLMDLGADDGESYVLNVTCERYDHQSCAFAAQVVQMGASGAFREIIGIIIFLVCFAGIISERIHRVYSAMLGASAAICAVSAIQETLHLHTVTSMIDFGTLMLLFSMMILMRMLQETGFFNFFAIKVVKLCNGNEKKLFFALTYICGILSMFLDNVTTVMLFGPLTYSLCKQMNLNPRYIYLPMAICATIGGTGTLIGDPPNIVIGSKLQIGFATFLKYNFPVICFVALPAACCFLYWKLKDRLKKGEIPVLDFEKLEQENRITDCPKFTKLGGILIAVLCSLLLAPLHHIEPAWFTVMAMFAGAILFQPHKIAHYLEHVEWDTLFFFAMLFCLVEALSELGVIKMLGNAIGSLVMAFPEAQRTLLSVIMLLWVCAFGSAFLESLPFTTTMVYILLDMKQQDTGDFDPGVMAWPLSVGACVGGIGSIMGSSANLVSMAVSNRQGKSDEERIAGADFLKHGLPTMMVVISLCMIWQILLFVVIGAPAE